MNPIGPYVPAAPHRAPAPAGTPAASDPVDLMAGPVHRGALHVPGRPGARVQVPGAQASLRLPGGGALHLAEGVLTRLDASGRPLSRTDVPASGGVRALAWEPGTGRAALVSQRELLVAGRDGLRRLDLGYSFDEPSLAVDPAGRFLVGHGRRLRVFDGSLREVESRDLGFTPTRIQPGADGSRLLVREGYPSHLLALDPAGKPLLEEHDVRPHSLVEDAHGALWYLRPGEVARFDPATGEVRRLPAPPRAEGVAPRADGSFVVLEQTLDGSALELRSPQGEPRGRYTFPDRSYVRQLLVEEDGSRAVAVIDRYRGDHTHALEVHALDLAHPGELGLLGLGHLASKVGVSTGRRLLHRDDGFMPRVVPVLLADGRVGVHTRQGVETFSASGRPQGLAKKVEGDTRARRFGFGPSMERPLPPSREAYDAEAERVLRGEGVPERTYLEFAGDAAPPVAAGSAVATARDVREGRTMARLPQGFLFASRRHVHFDVPGDRPVFTPGLGADFTHVLPLLSGQRPVAAACSTSGEVLWIDSDREYPVIFHLEGPARSLELRADGRVVATAEDGRELALEPHLRPGEALGPVTEDSPPQVG